MSRHVLLLSLLAALFTASAFAQACPPGASWCSGTYAYDGMGNIRAIGNDVYIYDTAGRLVSGTADVQRSGVTSRQEYGYDAFGNRTAASRAAGSVDCLGGCELVPTIDSTTNHITSNGATYDAAGNLTYLQNTIGTTTYSANYNYDTAGRLAQATANSDNRAFVYTADDERIAIANGASWTWTVRGLDGKVLREFTSVMQNGLPTASRAWAKDYVWRDGLLLASVAPTTPGANTTVTQHFHLDHLGTPRLVTGDNGVQLGIHAYYPFGAELNLSGSEQPTELMKFTGHERDLLGNDPHTLDDMHARYYSPNVARFLSVDPMLGDPGSPQSWNRYTYSSNSPINRTDPTGRCEQKEGEEPCSDLEITVTATNPSDEEHFLFLLNETKELDLPFMGDWSSAHLFANELWGSCETKQQEILAGHPVTPGEGVVLMGMALVGGPESAANAARLSNQLTGEEIAAGHAFDKHVIQQGEFPGVATRSEFATHIEQSVSTASEVKHLSGGRVAYWDNATQTVVIRNPNAVDGGTAFRPKQGKSYFDNLR